MASAIADSVAPRHGCCRGRRTQGLIFSMGFRPRACVKGTILQFDYSPEAGVDIVVSAARTLKCS
jgi:hypothetical protein